MDYAAAADALMRRKLLEEIYDRMTDDEKRLFVQMTLQQKSSDDIMKAIGEQSSQLAELRRRQQGFAGTLASNIVGNAVWAGAEWLLGRMARLV